jgi:hypothetical protein
MSVITQKISNCLAVLSLVLMSSTVLADCGSLPGAPDIPNGAGASMDELVASSQAVKAFIASADAYLDCREAAMATEEFMAQDKKVINAAKKEIDSLIDARNDIGDQFNKEVGAYKKANPKK